MSASKNGGGRRAMVLALLIRLLLVVAAVVALLPFAFLVRGLVDTLSGGVPGQAGMALSFAALLLGSFFFLYSVRYYLASLVMLLSSVVLTGGNGHSNSNGNGNGHPNGLMRMLRRGNGNGHANGNGNSNGHVELGYEPFVSIHIATYNEKRVLERVLQGCDTLEYGSYEVIVVDDSTDESAEIFERWQGRPKFKLIHRLNRDGFKGGALAVALQHMDPRAEFVIVWDADVVPFPDSIQTFLPHFFKFNGNGNGHGNGASGQPPQARPEVAAVQSYQWHILNKSENWLTEAVRAEYAGSYMVERPFQEFIGSLKMIAGTAYMIRANLLRQLGWGRSLTEDWELTLRLHLLGYKVVYTPYAESPAECVATFGRLARQRMRWAEGHSYNVRRHFRGVISSRHLGFFEKVEFLYYSTYYLQAALFILGSSAWFVAEVILHAHVPGWTAALGWTLLLTNLLALPIMNLAGLLLEDAPAKDFMGVLGALLTSFLLVPFQAYAALKGLFERDEGPWYRTPKTGHVTDPVRHLRRLAWLRRWLGPLQRTGRQPRPVAYATARPPARPARRAAWIAVGVMGMLLVAIGWSAINAPVATAAGTVFYMHGATSYTMDSTSPSGAQQTFAMTAGGATRQWATTSATTSSQTILSSSTFTFNYWTTAGAGATSNANLVFGYSASPGCVSSIARVQTGAKSPVGTNTVTPTLPAASTAGDLLVVMISMSPTVTQATGPAGWVFAAGVSTAGEGRNELWYYPNNPGGITTATFTVHPNGTSAIAQMTEWSGVATVAPLDQTATGSVAGSATTVTATTPALVGGGELAITSTGFNTAGGQTITPGAGWTNLYTDVPNGAESDFHLGMGAGAVSETVTSNRATQWSEVIATFKPAASITTIATSNGANLALGANLNSAPFSPASNVTVPAGSFFCYSVTINSVTNGGLTLDYDAAAAATNLNASQTIFIPELVLPLVGLALIAPFAPRLLRRRDREAGRL